MGIEQVLAILYDYYQKRKEEKKEKEKINALVNTITQIIRDYLDNILSYLENQKLENAKLEFEAIKNYYEDMEKSVREQGADLFINNIGRVRVAVKDFINDKLDEPLNNDNVKVLEEAYTLYCCIECYLIETYTELNEAYGYQLETRILEYIKEDLYLAYVFESPLFEYYFHKLHPDGDNGNPHYTNATGIGHALARLKKYDKFRKVLEDVWLHLKINTDPNFNKTNPEIYGGFGFDGISEYSIISVGNPDTHINQKCLAVNDKNQKTPHPPWPSIIRDLISEDIHIEKDTEITFEIVVKNEQGERQVELAVRELGIDNVRSLSEVITIDNNWKKIKVTHKKQYDETNIRCEVYWNDYNPTNLLLDSSFIRIKKKEIEYLGTSHIDYLFLWAWRPKKQRCNYFSQFFDFDLGYNSAQFIRAHNHGGTISNPSICQNLYLIPYIEGEEKEIDKEFIFECFLRNEKELIRTIEMVIWELGQSQNVLGKSARIYEVGTKWQRVNVGYKKQYYKSHLRFEIYWHDNEEVNLIVDNLKIYHP